jgi:hypothetical protein
MFNFFQKYYGYENYLILIICVLLFDFNKLIFLNISYYHLNYFFSGYFDDLLAPILLFSYMNLVLSFINKKIYSIKYLILIIILCSFVWEYLVIFIKPGSVSDPIDILCYFIGTLIYWIIYKNWTHKQNIIHIKVSLN